MACGPKSKEESDHGMQWNDVAETLFLLHLTPLSMMDMLCCTDSLWNFIGGISDFFMFVGSDFPKSHKKKKPNPPPYLKFFKKLESLTDTGDPIGVVSSDCQKSVK